MKIGQDLFKINIYEIDANGVNLGGYDIYDDPLPAYYYTADKNMERKHLDVSLSDCGTQILEITIQSVAQYQEVRFYSDESDFERIHILDLCNRCP